MHAIVACSTSRSLAGVAKSVQGQTIGYRYLNNSSASTVACRRLTTGLCAHACCLDATPVCRFLWVLQYLAGAGFYVIPAYQPADNSADNTVVATPAIFLRNWANLWASISDLPSFNATLKVCQDEGRYFPQEVSSCDCGSLAGSVSESSPDLRCA